MIVYTIGDVICVILLLLSVCVIVFLLVVNGIRSLIEKVFNKHSKGDDDNDIK